MVMYIKLTITVNALRIKYCLHIVIYNALYYGNAMCSTVETCAHVTNIFKAFFYVLCNIFRTGRCDLDVPISNYYK